jgi:hypothetical protein
MVMSFAVLLLSFMTGGGAFLPVCSEVSAADASAVLGVPAIRTKDPSGCVWEDSTQIKTLNVAYVKVAATVMFEGARADSAKNGTIQDEKGLGTKAFSSVPSKDNGGSVALYCLKGSTVLILDVEAERAATRLPQMRELMRKLASLP